MEQGLGAMLLLGVLSVLYLTPTIIASARGKAHGFAGVFLLNLFFGWSGIGWLIAFIWAFTGETHADIAKRDRQHAELLKAASKR